MSSAKMTSALDVNEYSITPEKSGAVRFLLVSFNDGCLESTGVRSTGNLALVR